jgi:hypothetical protein
MGQLSTPSRKWSKVLVAMGNTPLRASIVEAFVDHDIGVVEAKDGNEVVELLSLVEQLPLLPPMAVVLDGELSMFSSSVLLDMLERVVGGVPVVFINAASTHNLARYPSTPRPLAVLELAPGPLAGERAFREIERLTASGRRPTNRLVH